MSLRNKQYQLGEVHSYFSASRHDASAKSNCRAYYLEMSTAIKKRERYVSILALVYTQRMIFFGKRTYTFAGAWYIMLMACETPMVPVSVRRVNGSDEQL